MVEAALILPVIVLLILGIMEFGLLFTSYSTTTAASRSGARLAATAYSQAGTSTTAQDSAATQIAAATAADLEVLNNAEPIGMVIYKVNPSSTDGAPIGGFPGANMTGGCTSSCIKFSYNAATQAFTKTSGSWTNADACGTAVDSIGVYVQARHTYISGILGSTRDVDGHTVMRLEPLPRTSAHEAPSPARRTSRSPRPPLARGASRRARVVRAHAGRADRLRRLRRGSVQLVAAGRAAPTGRRLRGARRCGVPPRQRLVRDHDRQGGDRQERLPDLRRRSERDRGDLPGAEPQPAPCAPDHDRAVVLRAVARGGRGHADPGSRGGVHRARADGLAGEQARQRSGTGNIAAQLWVNIAGPNGNKRSGDRFQSKNCPTTVAGCTATANAGIQNDDYSFDGYFFALKVTSKVAGQPLNVDVYDPGMIYVGDTCTGATFPTAAQLTTLATWYPDAAQRFAGGLTSWCTGDQDIAGRTTQTTFIVREPDDTPWSFTDNPVVSSCTTTMPAYNPTGSNPTIFQYLNPTDGVQDAQAVRNGVAPWTFAEVFRQNVRICSIPAAQVVTGDYILQIRSNVTAASPLTYSAAVSQGGHNRMSLQTGFGNSGIASLSGANVSLNALGRLPIYANVNSANTNFYLARVLPYDAGRTLRVNLYDISDVGDSGTMQILPPAEVGGNLLVVRLLERHQQVDDLELVDLHVDGPQRVLQRAGGHRGRAHPDDYTCNPAVPTQCWITVRAAFNGPVTDTTTWSAAILGNPIRLVE